MTPNQIAGKHIATLNQCLERAKKTMQEKRERSQDLTIQEVYNAHAHALLWVADNIVPSPAGCTRTSLSCLRLRLL